jgi:hypothetical protein
MKETVQSEFRLTRCRRRGEERTLIISVLTDLEGEKLSVGDLELLLGVLEERGRKRWCTRRIVSGRGRISRREENGGDRRRTVLLICGLLTCSTTIFRQSLAQGSRAWLKELRPG